MNGILEWRDNDIANSYPFEKDSELNAVFSDATFVQYDNFIPSVQTVAVTSEGVTFNFLFDDGARAVTVAKDNCVDGFVTQVRFGSRYYGKFVLAVGVEALAMRVGLTLAPKVKFSGVVIRSISSKSGIFTINGAPGLTTYEVTSDYVNRLNVAGQNVTWSAVSLPVDIQNITFNPTSLYLLSDTGLLCELEEGSTTPKFIMDFGDNYTSILMLDTQFIAAKGRDIFDITSLPPTKLQSLPHSINALAKYSAGFIATTDNNIYYIANTDQSSYTAYTTAHKNAKAAVVTTDGVLTNTFLSPTVSELFYLNTGTNTPLAATVAGLFMIDSDNSLPPIKSLATIGTDTYGIFTDSGSTTVFKLNTNVGAATVVASFANDLTIGSYIGLTGGSNITMSANNLVPLKSINGVTPVENSITFSTGDVVTVQQTAQDELTLSLAPDIADTNIVRSTKYG